ncbi:uncharacterized protein LOC101235176 isoform X3 [Hydra vulgaris]
MFLLNWCNLKSIIDFRSKTIKEYNLTYIQYFNLEFYVKQSTESFYGACSYLSIDPPVVSNYVLNPFKVDFGVYFSIAVPSDLFFSPETGKLMSLLLYLRTSNGEKLPSSYWIELNGNNISSKITLDGFISYNQALQQSSYIFQLVASSPLLEESYRVLNISINSFPIIQQNFIVSFKGFVAFSISYLNFITRFISIMSDYLSISSSIIIFDVNTLYGQIVVKWSLFDLTLKNCNFDKVSLLKSKLFDNNGLPNNDLKNVINMTINYIVTNITFSAQLACLNDQNGPVRNEAYLNISIKDGLYRFILPLPSTTFIDAKDGDMSKLVLQLLLPNGENVPLSNWVQLLRSNNKDQLIGFLSLEIYSKKSWSFLLKATDSDGNYATKSYNFFIDTQPLSLYYQISLTLQTSVAEVVSLNDVELAFYIQEKKILPYSLLQNQGIFDVNTLIVLDLNVERNFNFITARLLWSSSIFSFSCDVSKIIRFRSKEFDYFKTAYNGFYSPEFTVMSNLESFIGDCSYLSASPPLVSNLAFIKVDVTFGSLFSINIPNDIFTPPADGSSMKLNIHLKGKDEDDLPVLYWISLSNNTLSNSKVLVGYASNDVAAMQTVYTFRLVAYTPLLINASRLFTVNIINYYQVKENFVVTMWLTSDNVIVFSTFIKIFLTTISNNLMYPIDSFVILKPTFLLNSIVIRWTLKEYAASECNFNELNRITNKLVYNNGQATVEFFNSLSKVMLTLTSISIEKLGVCAIDNSHPVPDEPLLNINVSSKTYRFTLLLKRTTFVDSKDGDMSNLKIDLLLENGEPVSLSNWVQISRLNGNDSLIGYIPLNVYNKLIWKFILKATNSDGNFATKLYIFNLESSPKQATYKMLLTLRSNYQNFVNSNDVLILFYIQDFKLMNYSQSNLQGISNVYSVITEDFKVSRNNGEILITLLWSLTDFVTINCELDKIVQLRRKNNGKFYTTYSNMFFPEFNLIKNTESFFDACSYLSADPPIFGAQQFQKVDVDSGSLFSVSIPSDLFRPPLSGSSMILTLELRNQNGEPVSLPWITLNGNIFKYGLRIEGYVPFDIASKQSSFIFQLAAITPLLEEIVNFFTVIISDNKILQLNYIVTFSSQSYIIGNYIFFSNLISRLSSYLSVRISSVIVIKFVATTSSTDIQWTLLPLTGSICDDVLIQAITSKIKNDGALNPSLISVLNNMNFVNTSITYSLGFACINDNVSPIPDSNTEDIIIQNNVYRFRLTLPLTTFVDKNDGNMNMLKIDFLMESKIPVPIDNWVQLQKSFNSYEFIGYVNILISSTYTWTYFIKATDKAGNAAFKKFNFIMVEKQMQANYRKNLTIRSFSPTLYEKTDVGILFYIQEQKLFTYSLQQNQGVTDLNTLITEQLQVTRNDMLLVIHLVWTSAIFISSSCDIPKVIKFRSKTNFNFEKLYFDLFLPEMTYLGETEEFLNACNFLTSQPPMIGPSTISDITIKYGEFFSIILPNDLFTSPSVGSSLSIYLRDKNGNALPDFYWISISSNKVINLRLEGYISTVIAAQQTNYLFRLVAVTSLQIEAYRLININVIGYKTVSQNVVFTFITLSTIGSYSTFINQFIIAISKYLSYSSSSILIISYDTSLLQTKIQWTMFQFTGTNCESSLASSVSQKLLYENSKHINPDLFSVLANINFILNSADIFISDVCTIDRNGPIPDKLSQEYTININVYRFSFILASTTFVDVKDGDMTKLDVELTTESGNTVSVDSWIEFVKLGSSFCLNGFISSISYTKAQWVFLLKATDSDKNVGIKKYIFNVQFPRLGPNYMRSLTVRSISSAMLSLKDVSVLFYIQEKKLIPYSIGQNQGFAKVDSLITDSLLVTRTNGFITVNLVWTSNIFVSDQCSLEKIIGLRSKTNGAYSSMYSQMFQPEFMYIEEKESFLGPCMDLSIDPPIIGPAQLNPIGVRFGEFFSINLPKNLFTFSSTKTSFNVYLADENGKALPDIYWIQLSTNIMSFHLRIEGYISNMIAIQKINYKFRIVAVTQLKIEAYRIININIQGYRPINKNFYVTVNTFTAVNIVPAFVNQFVLTIANYLSYSASSILIISYDTSSLQTKIQWTMVQFTSASCDSSLASSISQRFLDANGKVNPDLVSVLANINFYLNSVDVNLSDNCAIDRNAPVPDQPSQEYTININVYRFSFNLPVTTFVDAKDGDMTKLAVELTTESGLSVSVDSWIEFVQSGSSFRLNGFVSSISYTKAQWVFLLKATDSDKNVGIKKFIFNVKLPPLGPNYMRSLTVRSISSAMLSLRDVSVLFYIQEKKLVPYSIGQNQGFVKVDSLITDSLLVTRTNGFITVKLVWSSNIFVSDQCSLEKIISVRSKTTGAYSSMYSQMFQPEFMYVEEKESFLGPCMDLSIDPPIIGPATLNPISVKFGEFFSITLPSNLFSSPSVATRLSVYLRDENGNALPDFYWIALSNNNLAIGLRIEAYASNMIALQRTSYLLRLVAVTSLQIEAYRLINVNIVGYKPIQQKFVITFTTSSSITSFTVFVNQFILAISKYLSYSASSILIISYDTSSLQTKIQWTMVQFTSASCDSSLASSISQRFLDANGKVNPDLVSVLANINFYLNSVDVNLSDNCAIDRNAPVPDQPSQEYTININVYRFSFNLPVTTFVDAKDGDMTKLAVELTTESGLSVSVDSWIEFVQSGSSFRLNGFVSSISYTKAQWVFLLKATDSDKNVGIKKFIFNVKLPPLGPNYMRSLTVRSFSPLFIDMKDVSLLFYIYEKKLLPYFISQSQGIFSVDSFITDSFSVIRTTSYINIILAWSSVIFVSDECSMQKILSFRSKTLTSFSSIYSQMFQPEFIYLDEKEVFLNSCSNFSISPPDPKNPPNISAQFCQELYFEINENTFFDRIYGNTKSLYLELFTFNYEPLPFNEWVALDSNKQSIRGYPRLGTQNVVQYVYYYKLKATNKLGGYAFIDLTITLSKNPSLSFVYVASFLSLTNYKILVDEELLLISKLQSFFQMKVINDVAFSSINSSMRLFKWGFCDSPKVCFCSTVKSYRSLILPQKRFADVLSPEFTLMTTSDELYGICSSYSKPVENFFQISEMIVVGDFYTYYLPEDSFFDKEEGFTRNLTVSLRSDYSNLSWIYFDQVNLQVCALVDMQFYQNLKDSFFKSNMFQYIIYVQNTCGDSVSKLVTTTISYQSYFSLIDFSMLVSQSKLYIMSNCYAMSVLISKITSFSGNSQNSVFIVSINQINSTVTKISWNYRNITCINAYKIKNILTTTTGYMNFVSFMAPDYSVSSVSVTQSADCLISPSPIIDYLWILWLIIAIALLFLLIWLLWVCLPLCCPAFCATCCGGAFANCCIPCCTCCKTKNKEFETYSTLYADDPYNREGDVIVVPQNEVSRRKSQGVVMPKENDLFDDVMSRPWDDPDGPKRDNNPRVSNKENYPDPDKLDKPFDPSDIRRRPSNVNGFDLTDDNPFSSNTTGLPNNPGSFSNPRRKLPVNPELRDFNPRTNIDEYNTINRTKREFNAANSNNINERQSKDRSNSIYRRNENTNNPNYIQNTRVDYLENKNVSNNYRQNTQINNEWYNRKLASDDMLERHKDVLTKSNEHVKHRIATIRAPMLLPVPFSSRRRTYRSSSRDRRVSHFESDSDLSKINYQNNKHFETTVIDKDPYVYADAIMEIPIDAKIKRRSHSRRRRTKSDTDLNIRKEHRSIVGSSDEFEQIVDQVRQKLNKRFRGSEPELILSRRKHKHHRQRASSLSPPRRALNSSRDRIRKADFTESYPVNVTNNDRTIQFINEQHDIKQGKYRYRLSDKKRRRVDSYDRIFDLKNRDRKSERRHRNRRDMDFEYMSCDNESEL